MKRTVLLALITLYAFATTGQEITLYFPHFAGQEYDFYIFDGNKNDTIHIGVIPEDGKIRLFLPSPSKERGERYVGMGRWLLRSGGGLDFVINGEDFSIFCTEAIPNDDNIIYKDSPENDFLPDNFYRQQAILQKSDAIYMGIEAYGKEQDNPMYPTLLSEQAKQEKAFGELTEATIASPLYAARFRRINNFLNGWPMYALNHNNQEEQLKDRRRFVEEELNMDALHTSGLRREVIGQCAGLYEDEAGFMEAMTANLERTQLQAAYVQLAIDLIDICEQYGWQEQEEHLIYYLNNNKDRIGEPTGKLKQLMTLYRLGKGHPAPKLSAKERKHEGANVGTNNYLPEQPTLLLFYETGCGNCDREIQELKDAYPQLQEMGYRVISLSADTDERIFRNTADPFPWEEKYCDLQGFGGEDFRNYGIIGTPTIFVIDGQGIIQGRYAQVAEATCELRVEN